MNQLAKHQSPCPVCGEYKNRAVTVDVVIVNLKREIVLVKRANDPHKGKWALPGGFLDFDETVEEGTIREAAEEVGIQLTHLYMLGVYGSPERDPRQTVAIAYWAQSEESPTAGDDAAEVSLFSLDSLPEDLAFDHLEIVEDYIAHTHET